MGISCIGLVEEASWLGGEGARLIGRIGVLLKGVVGRFGGL